MSRQRDPQHNPQRNPRKTQQKPEAKRPGKFSNIVFLLFCMLIIVVFLALMYFQVGSYNSLRAENNRIQTELARQEAIYEDLRYQMAHFDSDAYIEQLARDRLGWVRPNVIVFRRLTE